MARELDALTVPESIFGIPGIAFGGYVAGKMAEHLSPGSVAVTLRRAPPLAQTMELMRDGSQINLLHDGALVATAAPAEAFGPDVPEAVMFGEAEDASTRYAGWTGHPYPRCFNCGPDRSPDEGLRIFPGPVAGRDVVAAPWIPHPFLSPRDGIVPAVWVWSALDCPTYWGLGTRYDVDGLLVTGRITAEVADHVAVGERYVVLGWPIAWEGRKIIGGAAVTAIDGRVIARAEATWVLTTGTVSDRRERAGSEQR